MYQKQQMNRAGIWLIVFSFPYLIVGVLGLIGYNLFNTQLVLIQSQISELPSEILELLGDINISAFSIIGTVIIIASVLSISIWLLMVVIGIINIRR